MLAGGMAMPIAQMGAAQICFVVHASGIPDDARSGPSEGRVAEPQQIEAAVRRQGCRRNSASALPIALRLPAIAMFFPKAPRPFGARCTVRRRIIVRWRRTLAAEVCEHGMNPPPAGVRDNEWHRVALPPPELFRPSAPVSVVVPYYEQPAELERALAALEGQTWPRELFEVVVVDDGSKTPLAVPSSPLRVTVVHQEDRGFGLARARNAGVQTAAHDILLFLDADMLPEAGWIAAHARWHHAVCDAVTLGSRAFVAVDDMDAETIRVRRGSLRELFAERPWDTSFVDRHMARTRHLTARGEDQFRVLVGSNFGIRRELFAAAGGFDETFTRWGGEDTEFGYRAQTIGALLVPLGDGFAWHQGRLSEGRERKDESQDIQRGKLAHLIAHQEFRGGVPGQNLCRAPIRGGPSTPPKRTAAAS